MYDEWLVLFESMDADSLADIIKAIAAWKLRGEAYAFADPNMRAIWAMILARLEDDKAAYEAKCKQNSENKKQQPSTTVDDRERPLPIEEKGREEKGREAFNNSKVRKQRTGDELFDDLTMAEPLDPYVEEAAREWLAYKKERRFSYKKSGMKVLISQMRKATEEHGADAVVRCVHDSIANGYQGIIWDRMTKQKNTRSAAQKLIDSMEGGIFFDD